MSVALAGRHHGARIPICEKNSESVYALHTLSLQKHLDPKVSTAEVKITSLAPSYQNQNLLGMRPARSTSCFRDGSPLWPGHEQPRH